MKPKDCICCSLMRKEKTHWRSLPDCNRRQWTDSLFTFFGHRCTNKGMHKSIYWKWKKILAGEFEGALIKHICSPLKEAYENCSAIALQRIYRSSDVLDIELAGFRVISTLIDLMINAVRSPEKRIHNYWSIAYPDSTMSTHLLYMENSSCAGLHIGHDRRICARPLPEDQRQQSAGSIIKHCQMRARWIL